MVTYCPLRQNHMTTIKTLSRITSDVYVSEERLFIGFLNFYHVAGSTQPQVSLCLGLCPDLCVVGT